MKKSVLLILVSVLGVFSLLKSQEAESEGDVLIQAIEIGESLSFHSENMQEVRFANIYLPPDYHPDSAVTYPVVYLLDGGVDEDFIHIAGLIQFATFPWIDMMPPSILVGVENVDRRKDFTYPSSVEFDKEELPTSGHSEDFIAYIAEELQPLIESRYHCSGDRMLIGQSLGGLLATEILYSRQELFNRYLIVSPSLWWDNGDLLDREMKLAMDKSVFIAVGKEGDIMENAARDLNDCIIEAAANGNQVDFLYFGEQDHGNIMHLAVYYGLQSFYPKESE